MKLEKCEVKECRAKVIIAIVKGRSIALNPASYQFVVEDDSGEYRLISGFQPHYYTCADISTRDHLNQATR